MSKQAVAVNLLDTLTEHEEAVYDLLFAGLNRKEIAAELCISLGTVKYHLNHIFEKLAVGSQLEALSYGASVGKVAGAGRQASCAVAEQWSEGDIRTAAAELVAAGLGDRKEVNAIVTDLLLALKKKL